MVKVKVTKAITSNGVYYERGSVHEMDESKALSYRRLYGWQLVTGKAGTSGSPSSAKKPATKKPAARSAKKPAKSETPEAAEPDGED